MPAVLREAFHLDLGQPDRLDEVCSRMAALVRGGRAAALRDFEEASAHSKCDVACLKVIDKLPLDTRHTP